MGQLQRPVGVAVLPSNGNIAIADYDNKWISIFDPTGKFMSRIGHGKLLGKHENSITTPQLSHYVGSLLLRLPLLRLSIWVVSIPAISESRFLPKAQAQNSGILVLKVHFYELVGKVNDTFKRNYLLNFYEIMHKIYYVLFICATRIHICLPVRMLSSFKGRDRVQIQSKCKILMLFLDENVTLFRMVYLVFLL